jgi:predicted RNase H-like HicB family nuclease
MTQDYSFKVLFEQRADGSYKAWAPALPACQASGASMQEVRSRIEEAIRCYCLNMTENGARIPQQEQGLPAIVNEIKVSVTTL